MQIKTISTAAGVNEIDFGNDGGQSTAHFYWLKNLGDSTLYVSANPNPVAEKDDVAELPAKGAVSVETDEGKIYVLGAGKVEVHRTNSKFCPFDWQSSGSGGGGAIDAYSKTESDAKYASKALYGDTTINVGRKAKTDVGEHSTAEGYNTTASGEGSHAEGIATQATGRDSHAEGAGSIASGSDSHAGGNSSIASGLVSFSHGIQTSAQSVAEVAFGKYNISRHNTLFSIGDGTADDARHNAFEITTDGGKLHDKDIATTDLIPTELPANGGNANTVGGKSASEFMPYIGYVADLGAVNQTCICSWGVDTLNTPFKAGKTNASAGICIVNSANGLWPTYFVICTGAKQCFIHHQNQNNGEFVGNWQEISTTPIKSTTVNGSTDSFGSLLLWSGSGSTPIAAIGDENRIFTPFIGGGNNYYLAVRDLEGKAIVNTTASATVFFI